MDWSKPDQLYSQFQRLIHSKYHRITSQVQNIVDLYAIPVSFKFKELARKISTEIHIHDFLLLLFVILCILITAFLVFGGESGPLEPVARGDPLDALSAFLLPKASIWPETYLKVVEEARKRARHSGTIIVQIDTLVQDLVDGKLQLRYPNHYMSRLVRGRLHTHGWTVKFVHSFSRRVRVSLFSPRSRGKNGVPTLEQLSLRGAKCYRTKGGNDKTFKMAISVFKQSTTYKSDCLAAEIPHPGSPLTTLVDILAYCSSVGLEITSIDNESEDYAKSLHSSARLLISSNTSSRRMAVMRHWEAGLHEAGILQRFTISLRRLPGNK